ncbi:MAG: hypothetical protein VKK59_05745 [Vampirovibrionales bacterium]|nr:hypothetical protein [Vampirovibrionales bacterium]
MSSIGSNMSINSVNAWFKANGLPPISQSASLNPFSGLGNIASVGNQQLASISGLDLNGASELRKLGLGDSLYAMAGLSAQDADILFEKNPYTGERLGYAELFEGLASAAPDNIASTKQVLMAVSDVINQLFGSDFNSGSGTSLLNTPAKPA